MSDSVRPHRRQPTRLPCPWDSPGKNTGVGCHFLLQRIFSTQGSNLGLPHCRQMLYHLSHQGRLWCRPSHFLKVFQYHQFVFLSFTFSLSVFYEKADSSVAITTEQFTHAHTRARMRTRTRMRTHAHTGAHTHACAHTTLQIPLSFLWEPTRPAEVTSGHNYSLHVHNIAVLTQV